MPFLSDLKDFGYTPYLRKGRIVRGKMVLTDDLVWKDPATDKVYTAPKGFVSDGNSRPFLAAWLIKKFGSGQRADWLHDWLFKVQETGPEDGKVSGKLWADYQYLLAMGVDRTPDTVKWASWSGVAVGGWISWLRPDDLLVVDLETMEPLPDVV